MDIDDKELFSSANADESIPEVAEQPAEKPAAEPQQDDRPRDEHGRFAPKQAEPEPAPELEAAAEQQLTRDDGGIPAWRLREMREERNAERQRAFELQRQLEMLQRQMPKPEPKPAPDPYENPDGFAKYHAQEIASPLERRLQAAEERLQAQLEYNSRNYAFQQYGEPMVRTAYDWTANGIRSQDPDVVHAYNRAMQSPDPYGEIVKAYRRASTMHQIEQSGGDPDKWAIQRAAELQQQQPAQAGRQQSSGQPQGSITKLPPSLRNTPSARSGNDDDSSDMSDAALFRHASR